MAAKSADALTAELAGSAATQEDGHTGGADGLEAILAGVLAGVMHTDQVPAGRHFFDEPMTAVGSPAPGSWAAESPVPGPVTVPPFAVIPGAQVGRVLAGREKQIVELVEATYRLHSAGDSVNPPSYFLRFPDRPASRIIALPASVGGPLRVDGLKWISSFPENVAAGLPRASAVLILNDHDTGYPFACLESSIISATRTAASAALAADWLSRGRGSGGERGDGGNRGDGANAGAGANGGTGANAAQDAGAGGRRGSGSSEWA